MKWKIKPAINHEGRRLYGEFEIVSQSDEKIFPQDIFLSEPVATMIVNAHNATFDEDDDN